MNREINCLSDLFIEIGSLIKIYEDSQSINSAKEQTDRLYSINEVTKIYPKLTKYILTKAINDGTLSAIWIGHERHFYAKDIENYLQSNTKKKEISNSINSWRTNEQFQIN